MKESTKWFTGLLVSAFALAGLATSPAFAQKMSDMDAVKAANESFFTALSGRDLVAMEKVWSPNKDIRYIGPRSKTVSVGWDEAKKSIQATLDAFPELKVSSEQTDVRINGLTAWVSSIEKSQRKTTTGEAQSGTNFGLNIFEKQGGKWLMVYHQASAIPQ